MIKIISSFKEKPKLKETWWTMRLGLASLFAPFLGIINGFVRRVFGPMGINSKNIGIPTGFSGVVLALVLSLSGVIISIRSYQQGERSWVLRIGFISALLVALFWLFMSVGELIYPH